MRLNKFLMFSAAALAFTACSNDEDAQMQNPNDNLPKKVTLSISNLQAPKDGTRALAPELAEGQVALKEAYVLFFDNGGNVVEVSDENKAKQQLNIQDIADNPVTFESLPKEVQRVGVFANYTTAGVDIKNATSLTQLRGVNLNLANQQDVNDIYMAGAQQLGAAETTGGVNFYKVNVAINPYVSRLEIDGFNCTNFVTSAGDLHYTNIKVEQIAMNGYYKFKPVGGSPDGQQTVTDQNKFIDFLSQGAEENPEADEFYKPAFTFDNVNNVALTETAPSVDLDGQAYGYNFFNTTQAIGYPIPGLLVGMRVSSEQMTGEKNVYLQVNSYNIGGNVINTSEAGKIYRMTMAFTADNLQQYATKDVEVTVTPADWVVVPVTPNYQ